MENEYKILNQLSPENLNPYSTPVGYFSGLADAILTKIKSKEFIYKTPENYFDNLSFGILQKVKQQEKNNDFFEELEQVAPLLNTISKVNVYSVSEQYFKNLLFTIPNEKAKIITLRSPLKWIKYLAAAVVIGIISISIFNINKVDKQALASYNQAVKTNVEKSIYNISDTELKNEIEADKTITASIDENVALPWNSLDNLQDEIQFVTDDEIESYLKENKIAVEDAASPNS